MVGVGAILRTTNTTLTKFLCIFYLKRYVIRLGSIFIRVRFTVKIICRFIIEQVNCIYTNNTTKFEFFTKGHIEQMFMMSLFKYSL